MTVKLEKKHFPNALTLARVVLAAMFFTVLSFYRYPGHNSWSLLVAIAVFVAAAVTDFLDGYLARRWKVESAFGRVMDPFADKLLVVGAFVVLCGPRFIDATFVASDPQTPTYTWTSSGVSCWHVISILARELLVTGIRDMLEGRGHKFGAMRSGKLKLVAQTVAIPTILAIVWLDPAAYPVLRVMRNVVVVGTVVITIISGVPYVIAALRATAAASASSSAKSE
jgi:phosphatidylglycerophosphate synthase